MGGIRVRRRSIHAEVSGGKIAAKLLAKDEPHKLNVSVETELTCLRLQSHPSISAADKYTMKVSSPQVINKVLKYSQQTVDTVLKAHDTHEADDGFSHPAQTTVRFDVSVKTAELAPIGQATHCRAKETRYQGPDGRPDVTQEPHRSPRRRVAIDPNSVHCFAIWLSVADRADNCHAIARCMYRIRFPPDSHVLRE